jgi:hypothetical protein
MALIVVTADVSQLNKSWLNEEASQNIYLISVTADVSQDEILPLKAIAPANMDSIVVTEEVFHFDKSWLNEVAV